MSGMRSRRKGKAGELELAKFLVSKGWGTREDTRRGQQFKGGEHSPDVVCEALSPIHLECKRTEAFRLYDALNQAREDGGTPATTGGLGAVAHRQNNKRWVLVFDLEDFLALADLQGWFNP